MVTNTQQNNKVSYNSLIIENKGITEGQRVYLSIENGYLIKERVGNGFYSVLRLPLYTIQSKQNILKDLGIKVL